MLRLLFLSSSALLLVSSCTALPQVPTTTSSAPSSTTTYPPVTTIPGNGICGGLDYYGTYPSTCEDGYLCYALTVWWYKCLPPADYGGAAGTPIPTVWGPPPE